MDEKLIERMVALTRRVAADMDGTIGDAQALVALLPEPIDPDILEVQQLFETQRDNWFLSPHSTHTNDGYSRTGKIAEGNSEYWEAKAVLAGIKRGRELERRNAMDLAAEIARNAQMPPHYYWGGDAMESFEFGKQRAAQAILDAATPGDDWWTPWHGGDMPIAKGTRLRVRYDNGEEHACSAGDEWSNVWKHRSMGCGNNIVAYRVVDPTVNRTV